MHGLFIAISGPSGVGKSTIIKMVHRAFPHAVFLISETTRSIRPREKAGEVYNFVSRELFKKNIEDGKFLEYALVHGKEYYGTLKSPVIKALENEKLIIREMDCQGMHQIKKLLPSKNLVTIFITVSNQDILKARISRRGKLPNEEVVRRMESAKIEMADTVNYDYRVINKENMVQECVKEVVEIIKKEVANRSSKKFAS